VAPATYSRRLVSDDELHRIAVPYALGVAEIIPAILIASRFRWWTPVAAFLVVATAAYRSDEDMFPGMSPVYEKIHRLLVKLCWCCVLLAAMSSATAIVIAVIGAPAWLITVMPWANTAIGLVMVLLTERCLTSVYADYGVYRR
jgi:hypothetical protein